MAQYTLRGYDDNSYELEVDGEIVASWSKDSSYGYIISQVEGRMGPDDTLVEEHEDVDPEYDGDEDFEEDEDF
jgi:hypothetical protein